jgi:tetratricopeptide (TPR) repeat protein
MDIITPALSLPPWTVTLTIIILAIGFPVTVVLSWIFDITPEGIKKTGELEPSTTIDTETERGRRKLRASDVIIVVLLIAVGFLVYPKIFNKDQLAGAREQSGKLTIAVLPFQNMSGDSVYNIWTGGFQNLLITNLSNSEELAVRQYMTVNQILEDRGNLNYASLSSVLAGNVAKKLETRTLIVGNILKSGDQIRINSQLVDAETEEIYQTFLVEGVSEEDFFQMADSLSNMIRNFVEIKNLFEKRNSPVFQSLSYHGSSEAFKYYLHGFDSMMDMDMQSSAEWFYKAIQTDSTFIRPYVYLAFALQMNGNNGGARYWTDMAYNKGQDLPLVEELILEHLYAYFYESPYEEIKYLNQLIEVDNLDPINWHMMAFAHYKLKEYEEAVSYWEHLMELDKEKGTEFRNPFVYFPMADSYHKLGRHKKEEEIMEKGLELFPVNPYLLTFRTICLLSQAQHAKAEEILDQYISFRENVIHCTEADISWGVGWIYYEAGLFEEAVNKYRLALQMDPKNLGAMNGLAWILFDEQIDLEEGMRLIDQALELQPDNWGFKDTRGWGLYKMGMVEESFAYLEEAWENREIYNHEGYLHLQEVENALDQLSP